MRHTCKKHNPWRQIPLPLDSVSTSMSSSSSLEENQELNQPDGFFFFFTLSGASTAYCTQTQAKHSIISASMKLTFGCFAHRCVLCTKSVFPYQCSALFPNHSSTRSSSVPWRRGRNLGAPILCPLFAMTQRQKSWSANPLPSFQITLLSDYHQHHYTEAESRICNNYLHHLLQKCSLHSQSTVNQVCYSDTEIWSTQCWHLLLQPPGSEEEIFISFGLAPTSHVVNHCNQTGLEARTTHNYSSEARQTLFKNSRGIAICIISLQSQTEFKVQKVKQFFIL